MRPLQNSKIQLWFRYFRTEKDVDYVTVYDGGDLSAPQIGRHSGDIPPETIVSTRNELLVTFLTDGSRTDSGFSLVFNVTVIGTGNGLYVHVIFVHYYMHLIEHFV